MYIFLINNVIVVKRRKYLKYFNIWFVYNEIVNNYEFKIYWFFFHFVYTVVIT